MLDWMKWYPGDFWGSLAVLKLSEAACNLYRWMLDYQWMHGSVPDDATVVSRLYPWGASALDSWREVRPLFDSLDGVLVNRKLAGIYAEQIGKTKRYAIAGKASAAARKNAHGTAQPPGKAPERGSPEHTFERRSNDVPNDSERRSNRGGVGEGGKGKGGKREKRASRAAAPPPDLFQDQLVPESLDTPEFRASWSEWMQYRAGRRLTKYQPMSVRKQLAALAEWGHDGALASIDTAIRNNSQGLFPPPVSAVRSASAAAVRDAELSRYPNAHDLQ